MQSLEVNQLFLFGLKVVLISVAAALSASALEMTFESHRRITQ